MMNKLIELKNLTKNFDDQQVLRGINLDIYEKEFLTLLGPSGCGKTTTLRIIAGFEEPSDGEVLFNGIEISKLPPYKREVNTVFQKYALFPHLNVASWNQRLQEIPDGFPYRGFPDRHAGSLFRLRFRHLRELLRIS